jgi:acetoin utilization protein AcuB
MFYLREISGRIEPYKTGAIRLRRIANAASPATSIGNQPPCLMSSSDAKPTGVAASAMAAYERVLNPDTPRRRVIFAAELMSTQVVTLQDDAPLSSAAEIFSQRRFRHIPVLNSESQLAGILSDRDVLRNSSRKGWESESVSSFMSKLVIVASKDTEIREIARVMFEERIGCMPITDDPGNLIGIVTRSDILRTLVVQAPLALWR